MPSKMHPVKRHEFGAFTLKTLSAAVLSAVLFSNADAAGLGKLTVLSALGQPLRAEIEITTVGKDESGGLSAKIASAEAFRQAGIEYTSVLNSLSFAVEQRGNRQFIRVSSSQPVNEPFVDMLLELGSPNGRLVREYTFLLDPPDLRTAQAPQVAPAPVPGQEAAAPAARTAQPQVESPSPAVAEATPPAARMPAAKRQAPAAPAPRVTAPAAPQRSETQTGDYKVKSGDSLGQIANRVRGGVSLDQMLVALFQANPDAFIGNNMNRLKAGQILAVPSTEAARGINATEAHGIVVAQAADFNNYRAKLAGRVSTAAPQKSAENKQEATGKITAKVEEKPTPASEAKDKLKLSNSMASKGANAGGGTAEDKIAKEKALAEANARVHELEKNVTDLQKILELKNKNLAEQQQKAESAKPEAKPAASTPVAKAPEPAKAEPAPEKPAASAPAASAPAPAPRAKPKAAPVPAPAPEPSFVDELLNNPLVLPGLGALLVALGGLGIYNARRKKKSKSFDDSIITDSNLKANSLFGSTGGQSVDTNNSVFNSSFSPSIGQLDSNEVDPVAEADVYIAYGRDAQAEEILKEALRTQPERHAVRVKLLEIYANRKDLRAFEVLATELYGMTKGEGPEWAQAATLGAGIDPNNPLYASGKKEAEPGLVAPTQPLDEQGLATLLATTQPDTSVDAEALEPDTSYFGNTELAADIPLESAPEPVPAPADEPARVKAPSSNDLEFDLEGMVAPEAAAPQAPAPAPAPAEDLSSIDFNFLDEPIVPTEPAAELKSEDLKESDPLAMIDSIPPMETPATAEPMMDEIPSLDGFDLPPLTGSATTETTAESTAEMAPLDIDIPDLPDLSAPSPAAEPAAPMETDASGMQEAEVDPLDFDLSGISLELNPSESGSVIPELPPDQPGHTMMDLSSTEAEMATKLDLAIAYQEIGDKEGARELLDEVLKGGNPEQSEKARTLLMELA